MRKNFYSFFAAAIVCCNSLLSTHNNCCGGFQECSNFWFGLDLLYWVPNECALVVTNKKSSVLLTDDFTKQSVVHPSFEWDWGYRLSAGKQYPSCCFDLEASWTHYSSNVSQQSSVDSQVEGSFPIRSLSDDIIAGDYIFDSKLSWRFKVNIIDLQLTRSFRVCDRFEIKPFLGLRNAWISQKGKVRYEGGIFLIGIITPGLSKLGSDVIKMKNDYWGIGPRIGVSPKYTLTKCLSIYGDAALSGLLGCFNLYQKETYMDVERYSYDKDYFRIRPIGDLGIGLQWKTTFCSCYAATFRLGWEYHILFDQFELEKDEFHLTPSNRNLSIQGATLSCQVGF